MTSIARRIAPLVAAAFTSSRTRDIRRWLAERRRRLRGEPHRVRYFHQVDDPYSYLASQVLRELIDRYDIEIQPHLVGPPSDAAAPERQRLEAFACRDAADIAPGYGLAFLAHDAVPDPEVVDLATRILCATVASGRFVAVAAEVGRALWSGSRSSLGDLARLEPAADPAATRAAVEAGTELRRRHGHYLGAMFHYGGEWYWGVDRLHHLERRLQTLGALRPDRGRGSIIRHPDFSDAPSIDPSARVTLEFFLSLRSPYTYIAMERVSALARRYPIDLVLRPVLPMVMRGLPVPSVKRIYITLDTKREADDAGVPFGRVCDPVGRPVERAFSLFGWARSQGRAAQFLLSFARAAFAEGVDTGENSGLQHVVERAGLAWIDAQAHLDRDGWQGELEENRAALLAMGLWGVPSFRVAGGNERDDFSTWGQDRLWRIEQEIRRRLAPPSPAR
ncbi:MAG TPA: DsbA family protein [Candidatus Binatia bacterium]|nr:DsbA family protein [Candidatus Binatia bacterium]